MKSAVSLWPVVIWLMLIFNSHCSIAQSDIPINTWRVHPSFTAMANVSAGANGMIYAASAHGILVVDTRDNSATPLTTLDGLKGSEIGDLQFDPSTGVLLVAYADGTFDILDQHNRLINIDPTAAASLTLSKRINSILIRDGVAYICTRYGVVVFDLTSKRIRETWRNLGDTGQPLEILQAAIKADSIFLATTSGVIAGKLIDNLQDFNRWTRFNAGIFNNSIPAIATFNNAVYCAINNSGVYRLNGHVWDLLPLSQRAEHYALNTSASGLFVLSTLGLSRLDSGGQTHHYDDSLVVFPKEVIEHSDHLWIADGRRGLVYRQGDVYDAIAPDAPVRDNISGLTCSSGIVYGYSRMLWDGPTDDGSRTVDLFRDGTWSTITSTLNNITDVVRDDGVGRACLASSGGGVEVRSDDGTSVVYDERNSPLMAIAGKGVDVSALAINTAGLWIANYGATSPLHVLSRDGTWQSFSFTGIAARYPLKIVADRSGVIWMILDPAYGGGVVVVRPTGEYRLLTNDEGQGSLPSREVYSIAVDRDGQVWIGTRAGVAYFDGSDGVFGSQVNSIKPVVDGRFLLRDDRVTAIAVDGGNRKWFGTDRGVWLYSSGGDVPELNLNVLNSPLPSDSVNDIIINQKSGEVFFATEEGLASYRAGSTTGEDAMALQVFPNPVHPGYGGVVAINGTPTDAIVKITDISGKLMWQGRAHGAMATWNLLDNRNRRVPTGVYIVFVVTADGGQREAAKVAVIE